MLPAGNHSILVIIDGEPQEIPTPLFIIIFSVMVAEEEEATIP